MWGSFSNNNKKFGEIWFQILFDSKYFFFIFYLPVNVFWNNKFSDTNFIPPHKS